MLVMELMPLGSLRALLDWAQRGAHQLGRGAACSILLDVGLGMKHLAGKGITHRDLKPGK